MTDAYRNIIKDFYEAGKGLYIWGDNHPFFADSNEILNKLFPGLGMKLEGNDPGRQTLNARTSPDENGFDSEHVIFTGIENLYEGYTIARVIYPTTSPITTIAKSSHGYPVTCILDDGYHHLVIDGGFTRLFPQVWNVTPGTSRFVKNISAWLYGIDSDWVD